MVLPGNFSIPRASTASAGAQGPAWRTGWPAHTKILSRSKIDDASHRSRPYRAPLLAGPVALSGAASFPRLARHPGPLQADRHRVGVGGVAAVSHDARVR